MPVLDWIDREIADQYSLRFEKEFFSDTLLELRQLFMESEPRLIVRQFYQFLPKLEESHYLLGYRIRQWFSHKFTLELCDPLGRVPALVKPVCPMMKSIEAEKKAYFEQSDYALPYHDIRVTLK